MLWSAVTSKTNGIISANQQGEILKHDGQVTGTQLLNIMGLLQQFGSHQQGI